MSAFSSSHRYNRIRESFSDLRCLLGHHFLYDPCPYHHSLSLPLRPQHVPQRHGQRPAAGGLAPSQGLQSQGLQKGLLRLRHLGRLRQHPLLHCRRHLRQRHPHLYDRLPPLPQTFLGTQLHLHDDRLHHPLQRRYDPQLSSHQKLGPLQHPLGHDSPRAPSASST